MLAKRMGTVAHAAAHRRAPGRPAPRLMDRRRSDLVAFRPPVRARPAGGCARPGADLELDTLVESTPRGRSDIGGACRPSSAGSSTSRPPPLSIAEISAHLHLHLGIARVLVSDLVADESRRRERALRPTAAGPDLPTLERLLDDLQAL